MASHDPSVSWNVSLVLLGLPDFYRMYMFSKFSLNWLQKTLFMSVILVFAPSVSLHNYV